jgi:DNA-binding XRE family transcriptional regulator
MHKVQYEALFYNLSALNLISAPQSALKHTFYCFIQIITSFHFKRSQMMHFESIVTQAKQRREELQVTQETLADISGVDLRTLKQFESGKGNPTLETLSKIADALGLEVSLQLKSSS